MDTATYIKNNEGLRFVPYKCSMGKLTVGYGRNLTAMGIIPGDITEITIKEAETMFNEDMDKAINGLRKIFSLKCLSKLSDSRVTALTDMMFNLGETKFKKFKKMIRSVEAGHFDRAAVEVMDSKYAKQVPNRAKCNATKIRGN